MRVKRRPKAMWKQPWGWRWKGRHKWHRLAIGPLCLSIWPGGQGRKWFIGHSWQFRNSNDEMRHVATFRRWLQKRHGWWSK